MPEKQPPGKKDPPRNPGYTDAICSKARPKVGSSYWGGALSLPPSMEMTGGHVPLNTKYPRHLTLGGGVRPGALSPPPPARKNPVAPWHQKLYVESKSGSFLTGVMPGYAHSLGTPSVWGGEVSCECKEVPRECTCADTQKKKRLALTLKYIYYYTPLPLNLANKQQATSNNNTSPCRFGHCTFPTPRA